MLAPECNDFYLYVAQRLLEVRMAIFRLQLVCRWSEGEFEVYQDDEDEDNSEDEDEDVVQEAQPVSLLNGS